MDWKSYLNEIVQPLPRRRNYILNYIMSFVAGATIGIVSIICWPEQATRIGGTVLFLLFGLCVLIFGRR